MIVQVKRKQDHAVSNWAGGSTTELIISPAGTTCAERNFAFRVSSATVELPESVFSDFSGYTRHITPLEGSMELWHDGKQAKRLLPFDVHTFDGSWKTRSVGTCVDFNLIHNANHKGNMTVLLKEREFTPVQRGHTGLYVLRNGLQASGLSNGESFMHTLNKGDYLSIDSVYGEHPAGIQLKTAPEQNELNKLGGLGVLVFVVALNGS